MTYVAIKVVIITEKIIFDGLAAIIEEMGGTGYTVVAAGGKGRRSNHKASGASVVDAFRNIKVEVIVNSLEMAEKIADAVAERYFGNYSGITYLEEVQILRPHKFDT